MEIIGPSRSISIADGDKKALAKIMVNNQPFFVISENDGYFTFDLDGSKIKEVLYHGRGFLSSSSRIARYQSKVSKNEIYTFTGLKRILIVR